MLFLVFVSAIVTIFSRYKNFWVSLLAQYSCLEWPRSQKYSDKFIVFYPYLSSKIRFLFFISYVNSIRNRHTIHFFFCRYPLRIDFWCDDQWTFANITHFGYEYEPTKQKIACDTLKLAMSNYVISINRRAHSKIALTFEIERNAKQKQTHQNWTTTTTK